MCLETPPKKRGFLLFMIFIINKKNMKHLLNNLSEEEKNSIRNQYTGEIKVVTENFKKLLNSKLGDVRPLVDDELLIEEKLIGEQGFKDFFKNIFSGKKDKESEVKIDDPKKADLVDDDVAEFYKTLESIKEPISQQQKGKMNFQKDVETVQIALQLLGYELPKFGVDGLFGPETGSAVIKFKTDNKLNESFKHLNESLSQIDTFPVAGGQYNIGWDKDWDDFSNPSATANSDFTRKATNAGAGGHKNGHIGVDIFGKRGTPIVAPVNGKVKYGGNGLTVIVQDDKTGLSHWLGHLESITVKEGEFVSAGQQVGTLGNSGNASGTAPHLHYNVYKTSSGFNSGEDPIEILKGAISKSTNTPIKKNEDGSENEYKSEENGSISITPKMIKDMIDKLKSKGIKSEDLKKYLDMVKTGGGGSSEGVIVTNDKEFYEQILKGIGAPITESNLKFLYAWRQAEGSKSTNNPFNTTLNLKSDNKKTNYNSVGVKNYSTPSYGVEATVKTLLNGYYDCIVDGLRNDSGAEKISKMCISQLKTWGTGGLVSKVLQHGSIKPPPIYSA
jgi:murein DD-endopeptidase MepM/ murein hydrolase activator NlpD